VGEGWGADEGRVYGAGESPSDSLPDSSAIQLPPQFNPTVNIGAKARVLCAWMNALHAIHKDTSK
jgi:hypothetical protein